MNFNDTCVVDEHEALHNRTIRFRIPENFSTLIFLQQGVLRWGEDQAETEGPALCFWPQQQRPVLTQCAGARVRIVGLSDGLVLEAIGARAESVHLRMLLEQPFIALLADHESFEQIQCLFEWYGDECADTERQSPMTLSAYLRLVFISALRICSPEPADVSAEQSNLLRQFRHLVELHYREHWQVGNYAEKLGVDRDRLHRICKRETGRSPAELVHERLTAEAKVRLEKTGFPLKKIAADLGF